MLMRLLVIIGYLVPAQAIACVEMAKMELSDAFNADAVVVGKVIDYEIVDVGYIGPLPNYARIKVKISKVIAGDVSQKIDPDGSITITWDNSTFGEPESFERKVPFLFVLRNPSSPLPPLRAGSGVILPTPEKERFTVLQAPCASALIFEADSPYSQILQQVLETDRDPKLELQILEEFVFERQAFTRLERDIVLLKREVEQLRRAMPDVNEAQ